MQPYTEKLGVVYVSRREASSKWWVVVEDMGSCECTEVQIGTEEVEGVQTYKYLGLWLDNRLDWTSNTRQLYKKTQSRMYFLRRLRSFNICRKLLWMFYQLEKLIRRASSVVGMKLKPLATVAERRTIDKLRSIMDNDRHPLHTVIHSQRSLINRMEIADLSITAFIPAVYLEGGRLSKPVGALPPYCAFLALAGPLFVVAFEKCRKGICKSQNS
ncbi:hypothetical protein D4764_03G0011670 [Takifugu flavidus]|uniref:Alkylated DNA repair protein AlkB homologue 8 N-terminal domain-containing protein n=1 Tax=Takifugu flavidus TaxID=433684 RepID=A0A5C6NBF6_9TELE|nr:hypothetical protein D4764_03G0011670 [Takifugu flavidus]